MTTDEVPARVKPWWRRSSWADLGIHRGRPLPRSFPGVAFACCVFMMIALVVVILFASGPLPGEVPPLAGITLAMFTVWIISMMGRQRPRHWFLATCASLAAAVGLVLAVHQARIPNLYGRAAADVVAVAISFAVCFGVTRIPRPGGRPDPPIVEPSPVVDLELLWETPGSVTRDR